jgi:hypothetical protein
LTEFLLWLRMGHPGSRQDGRENELLQRVPPRI